MQKGVGVPQIMPWSLDILTVLSFIWEIGCWKNADVNCSQQSNTKYLVCIWGTWNYRKSVSLLSNLLWLSTLLSFVYTLTQSVSQPIWSLGKWCINNAYQLLGNGCHADDIRICYQSIRKKKSLSAVENYSELGFWQVSSGCGCWVTGYPLSVINLWFDYRLRTLKMDAGKNINQLSYPEIMIVICRWLLNWGSLTLSLNTLKLWM